MNIYRLKRIITDTWYKQVQCRINPRQKWATKVIPRTFTDIDYLIEEVTFAALINFWENDDGEHNMRYQYEWYEHDHDEWTDRDKDQAERKRNEHKKIYDEVNAAYQWAKIRNSERTKTDDLIEKRYGARVDESVPSLEQIIDAEETFYANDTKHLMTIILYRNRLWT